MGRKDGKRPGNWSRSQEQKRVDAERWRALQWLVKDAEYWLPIYERQGNVPKVHTARTIIDIYGPIVQDINASVHPDRFGAHRWSRLAWQRLLAQTMRMMRRR